MNKYAIVIVCLLGFAVFAQAQTPVNLAPNVHPQFLDATGKVLAGGFIYTYAAGTTTRQDTYTDSSGSIANAWPIPLDATGAPSNGSTQTGIWLTNTGYKFCALNSALVQQWCTDNLQATPFLAGNNAWTGAETHAGTETFNGSLAATAGGSLAGTFTGSPNFSGTVNFLNPPTFLLSQPFPAGITPQSVNGVLYANQFTGSDCGAQINAAYASLPTTGGVIYQTASCSFTTPIIFATNAKPVLLQGFPGGAVTLTYTPVTGVAITFNYGTGLTMGKGMRDITLTGPGNGTSTTGIIIGGTNGAQGTRISNSKIQSFGTDLQFGNNEWVVEIDHTMIRDGGTNVLAPSGLTQAGENNTFDHVVFADAPNPHTNSVWIQGGGQEYNFTNCSFDQAQLRVGNSATSSAQVSVIGSHFENPDFATGVDYDYVVVDNNNGNFLRLSDDYMLEDRTAGGAYAEFMKLQGGVVKIDGLGMFSPVVMTNVALLSNAVNIDLFGFNDLSGNATNLLGGSTTGSITSIPGVNTGASTGFNSIIGGTGLAGGAKLDVTGNIRTSTQLVSLQATGTAPFVVSSTTPVNNLVSSPTTYNNSGTQQTNAHIVIGTCTLGTNCSVSLSGSAAYTNSSSYFCGISDASGIFAAKFAPTSGSAFVLTGNGTDVLDYVCAGN